MTPYEIFPKLPVGRPRVGIQAEQVSQLHSQGASWREIAKALGIGTATAMRLFRLKEARPNIQQVSPNIADGLRSVRSDAETEERMRKSAQR